VVGGAGAEDDDGPVLLAALPLPSLELHAVKTSAASVIAARSEKKRRIQLTSNNYSVGVAATAAGASRAAPSYLSFGFASPFSIGKPASYHAL
jgi:hypothetical protein